LPVVLDSMLHGLIKDRRHLLQSMDELAKESIQELKELFNTRSSRTNLDTTKYYMKIQILEGELVQEEVGRFVRYYTMGSGDGSELFWEFTKDGKIITVSNQMWGTVAGHGLIHFKEVSESKN